MPGNKSVLKGALAVATGTALLVGGFGSFALWSEQDPLPNDSIAAGELSLAMGTKSWADESPDAVDEEWDPATHTLVPGDTVTLTVPITVTAVGKNLEGTIDLDPTAAFNTTAFGPNFTVTYDVAPTLEPGVEDEGDGSVSFRRGAMLDDEIDATGTVTFALSSEASLDEAERATASLSGVEFVTTQVRPTLQP